MSDQVEEMMTDDHRQRLQMERQQRLEKDEDEFLRLSAELEKDVDNDAENDLGNEHKMISLTMGDFDY